ncbi:MAG: hypothetical protein ACYDA4_17445 [Ignavibacteriaceae bacterium]
METIHWYNYLAAFFAGAFLINAIPHLVQGLSGNYFPTPFAKPTGRGLSSPLVNTLWAFGNLIAGFFLFKAGKIDFDINLTLFLFFVGMVIMGIVSTINFSNKMKM